MASRYRVEAVLTELGIEILDEKDGELVAHCPGHLKRTGRQDRKPSWSISADSGEHHCFSCGYGGTLAGLVAGTQGMRTGTRKRSELDLDKAQGWLTRFGTEVMETQRLQIDAPMVARPTELPEHELGRFGAPPQWALEARQIDAGAANTLGVQWDPQREAWVTPIRDPVSLALWGWQLKGQGSRLFRNLPPGVAKTEAVFALEHAGPTVVLVESPLDAVRLKGLGVDAVSSYGAAVSEAQMTLILARAETLIVALDNPHTDDSGRTNSLRLLKEYGQLGIRFWPYTPRSPKDPGDMTDAEILDGIQHTRHSVRGRRAVLQAA